MRPNRTAFLAWFASQPADRLFYPLFGVVDPHSNYPASQACPLAAWFNESLGHARVSVTTDSCTLNGKRFDTLPVWVKVIQEHFFESRECLDLHAGVPTIDLWATIPQSWRNGINPDWEVAA